LVYGVWWVVYGSLKKRKKNSFDRIYRIDGIRRVYGAQGVWCIVGSV